MMSERNSEFPPLLSNNIEKGSWNPEDRDKGYRDIVETIEKLRKQLKLAGPLVLVSFFQMISIMFVGHLGELPLSSATLAISFAGVTGFSFMIAGNGKCTGNIMRTSLWGKLVSYARDTYAKRYACIGSNWHPYIYYMGIYGAHICFLWSGHGKFNSCWTTCSMVDSKHFSLWTPPMPTAVPANTKQTQTHGDQHRPHYNLNLESIALNGQTLAISPQVFETSSNGRTIVDSGTPLAYLAEEAYKIFVNDVSQAVSQDVRPLVARGNQCYLTTSSVGDIFPMVSLNFAGGATMVLRGEDYLIQQNSIGGVAVWCMGFQKISGQGLTILGDLVLKDKIIVYDLAGQRIEWVNYDLCNNVEE